MTFDRRKFLQSTAAGSLAATSLFNVAHSAEPGVVRWLMAENTTGNWDPSANTTLSNTFCEFLAYDYLFTYPMVPGTDVTKPVLSLAQSYKVLDPYTVEIELRKGVRFHDGAELVADDVKASFEHYSRPKIARAYYGATLQVKVTGKHSVVINSKDAGVTISMFMFLQVYAPILRAKDVANPKALQTHMNGTGPFRFAAQEQSSSIFEANPTYWGSSKTKIKRVIVRHVPDSNARVLALLSGEAEIIERLEPEQYQSIKQKPGFSVSSVKSVENKFLHFRNNRKPFDDWRVRRAAAAAIDRDAILSIAGEAGYAADCLVTPMKLGYIAQPNYGKFDPAECQRLLAAAGYPNGKGMPEIEYITSTGFYPKTKDYGEAVTAMLQAQGFPVKLTVMEVAAWNDRYYNPNAGHMIDGGWCTDTPDPDIQLWLMYYSKIGLVTGANDPELDAVLLKERNAPTIEIRRKVLQTEALPLIAQKMPNLVLFNSRMLHAMTGKLKGVSITAASQVDFTKASIG